MLGNFAWLNVIRSLPFINPCDSPPADMLSRKDAESIHKVLNYRNKERRLLVTVYCIFSLF